MTKHYHSLSYTNLGKNATTYQPNHMLPGTIKEDDPAVMVMTDLKQVKSYTVSATDSIVEANEKMIACNVRLLFVTNDNDVILGVITANDILGEKPVNYIREHGGTRASILVRDIMTPHEKMDALDYRDVQEALVGDIVRTLRSFQRHHILVVEKDLDNGTEQVRGIFSTTQVSTQLGIDITPIARARTFAELEMALVS